MSLKRSRRQKQAALGDINMTPMIDLMSLLLICVLATAPMMTTGISLDLPKGDGKAMEDTEKSIDISVDGFGKIYIGEEIISPKKLVAKLQAMLKVNPDLKVLVGGDKSASYGQVIELMSYLRLAGISKIGLKTNELAELEDLTPSDKRK